MTRRDVLELAIKVTALIFGIIYVFQFFGSAFGMLVSAMDRSEQYSMGLVVLTMVLFVAIASLLLGRFSGWVARKLLPGEDPIALPDLAGSEPSILLLALKCAAAAMLFLALSSLMSRIASDLFLWGERGRIDPDSLGGSLGYQGFTAYVLSYVGGLLQLLLSLYLLFGAGLLVRIAFGRKTASQGAPESGTTGSPIGTHPWEEPVFLLACRVIAVFLLVADSWWLTNALLLQWVPRLRQSGRPEMDWASFWSGVMTVGCCVYLLSGARHLVDVVFHRRISVSDAGGTA